MVFQQKKVQTETLCEYLSEVRKNLDLSLEEVSQKTGIKFKFLENLEAGKFNLLPADVYVLGFLKQLANVYGIADIDLINQYKKERNIDIQVVKQKNGNKTFFQKYLSKLVVTPKLVSLVVGVAFVVVSLGYIVWQVLSINKAPTLEIYGPEDRQVIKDSFVEVVGKTDAGMSIFINEQNVFVDPEGNFRIQLGITAGPKDLVVTAKNKFDKAVTKTISIIGESSSATLEGQLVLKVEASSEVTLNYSLDDGSKETVVLGLGESKTINAKRKVLLSTTNAGATRVTLNNQLLGPMGRNGEELKDIPFFAESGSVKE